MERVSKKKVEMIMRMYLVEEKSIGEIALLVGLEIPIVCLVLQDNIKGC